MRWLVMLLCWVLSTATAWAQKPVPPPERDPDIEVAKRHFQAGAQFYESRQYDKALLEFEAAQLVKYKPELDYNIARCLERLERYDAAATAYERYLMGAPNAPDVVEARERIKVLKERAVALAELRASSGTPPAPAPTPTEKPQGSTPAVTPPPPPAPSSTPSTSAARPSPSEPAAPWYRGVWLPAVTGALAVAALGAGAGLYGWARADYDHLRNTCAPACDPPESQRVVSRGTTGIALMAVGGVLAAGTTAIAVWRSRGGSSARVGALALPGSAALWVGGEF